MIQTFKIEYNTQIDCTKTNCNTSIYSLPVNRNKKKTTLVIMNNSERKEKGLKDDIEKKNCREKLIFSFFFSLETYNSMIKIKQ